MKQRRKDGWKHRQIDREEDFKLKKLARKTNIAKTFTYKEADGHFKSKA
jgi:hypothetical protein